VKIPKSTKAPAGKSATAKTKPAAPVVPKLSRTHRPEGMELVEWQRLLRRQFGEQQAFRLSNIGGHPIFSDFGLTNPASGKTYRVAIRGDRAGDNFCSCPDFRVNALGTCKHIEFTLSRLRERRGGKKALRDGYVPPYSEVYLSYGLRREVRFRAGTTAPKRLRSLAGRYFDVRGVLKELRFADFASFLGKAPQFPGHELRCYDDVMEFVAERQDAGHRLATVEKALPQGIDSPLFDTLLKTGLYPYQREGVLFAVRAGRSLLADDMGLGKTVQAIAAAELMARLFGVGRVLVVAPTSLKHQWKTEIETFTDRSATVIEGLTPQRRDLYRSDSFFKLLNYELVHRDADLIREWGPELIILDEAQRIKNWQTRTAQAVKRLDSPFALVLTGTPLENRIEELHSIMEFVDRHHLGPLYRFVHAHRVTDEGGKVVGYRDLDRIRASLKGAMLRRRKSEVLKQLPQRIDKNFFVPLTPEQARIHQEFADTVAQIVNKWRRFKFLSEADSLRLRIALASMRMVADNTFLVDKKTVFGPKLAELETLLKELVVEGGEKVVVFSQWLRMNELVEEVLTRNGIGYVHLNGSVPSKDRKGLMTRFKEDPDCKVFLSTDAGGVGLNLQSGSTVVNLDIPWNPAILEQRIARVHRMGQKRPVRVVNFISRNSIEERILDLLRFKKALFAGALDEEGRDTVMIGESQLDAFMRSVEEATEGLKPVATAAEQEEWREEAAAGRAGEEVVPEEEPAVAETEPVTAAGAAVPPLGELLQNGARLLMELGKALSPQPAGKGTGAPERGESSRPNPLGSFVEVDQATGRSCLKIPLPEPEVMATVVSGLGQLLAGLVGGRK
jgi:superfamily II DNA or RNA helicase